LILDEPTNHLGLLSLEALERALLAFPGAILAATHDRAFIEKVATTIWRLRDGRLIIEPV
ncbi:MAG: ABC transporter ATP-binding protein, partial [Chloroflexi bacterium]|nr:ABC transporter ATP-binding protein [Chloroflexota bacterium]